VSVLVAVAALFLAAGGWARAQVVEKTGQADVPVLADNLDAAKTRAIRDAQVQAVAKLVEELVAPEWLTLYEKDLRRRIYSRVDRYISAFRTQRLEPSADRTQYSAVVSAQVSRVELVEDLREMGLPVAGDPRKALRIAYSANDPVLAQPALRTPVLGALQHRLEMLNYRIAGTAAVDGAQAELLANASSDSRRRAEFLARLKVDALLFVSFRMGGSGAAAGMTAIIYQGTGGQVLGQFDRQTQAAQPRDGGTRLRDFILAELANPLTQQVQPNTIRSGQGAGAGARLDLRVAGFASVAEEEAFEGAFFRRGTPFAQFAIHRIEPDAVVYQGVYTGNRDTLERELSGRQVGDFVIRQAAWMDTLLDVEVARNRRPPPLELELYPVERRPAQIADMLKAFFGRSTALEVQDPAYAEKEDNGWLERANGLVFNATVYGQVDSRTDADFYAGEALTGRETLDIVWYRVERTNLTPVIRVYDEKRNAVKTYTPRTYTRFTYRVPEGQHKFYLEVADRYGQLKADTSGYLKFHYLLLVRRQGRG
jgi:hypothetical protein